MIIVAFWFLKIITRKSLHHRCFISWETVGQSKKIVFFHLFNHQDLLCYKWQDDLPKEMKTSYYNHSVEMSHSAENLSSSHWFIGIHSFESQGVTFWTTRKNCRTFWISHNDRAPDISLQESHDWQFQNVSSHPHSKSRFDDVWMNKSPDLILNRILEVDHTDHVSVISKSMFHHSPSVSKSPKITGMITSHHFSWVCSDLREFFTYSQK